MKWPFSLLQRVKIIMQNAGGKLQVALFLKVSLDGRGSQYDPSPLTNSSDLHSGDQFDITDRIGN